MKSKILSKGMYTTKQKHTHRHRGKNQWLPVERQRGMHRTGYEMKRYKLPGIKQISNKGILYSTGK